MSETQFASTISFCCIPFNDLKVIDLSWPNLAHYLIVTGAHVIHVSC